MGSVVVGDIVVIIKLGNFKCNVVIFVVCFEWDNGKGKKVE